MLQTLLLFDETKPAPTVYEILLYTVVILVLTFIIFSVLCKILRIDSEKQIDNHKNNEYEKWEKNGLTPSKLMLTEALNSTLYAPVAEELVFRVFLTKFLLVKGFGLNKHIAILIEAILFGSLHLTNQVYSNQDKNFTYLQSLSATIAGIVSGYVYIKSNSILPSLFAHMINNGIASIEEVIGYNNYLKDKEKTQ
jgi:membrane protease YdiL (CAAX protease family)